MKKILVFSLLLLSAKLSFSQGCVAIRSNGNTCTMSSAHDSSKWVLNINNRYFKSFRHFVGTEEQKQRLDSATEVINYSYSMDITLGKKINSRWTLAASLPIISNVRSSKYEHYGNASTSANARNKTHAFGIGDLKLLAYRWMFDPNKDLKGNLQLGFGIKLPTGDYRVQDYFHKNDSTIILGPVDQSIQLGDGGTGFTVEAKGYYHFVKKFGVYGDVFYLINPREQNGVSTARGGNPSATQTRYFTSTMSVPDQYMARAGASFQTEKFMASAGARLEGIPSSDLIGGDKGFRRPGYVLSIEPVISYKIKKVELYASGPVAIQRNRVQSYSDKLQTKATGIKVQGDAAFADYSLNLGCTIKF